MLPTHNFHPLCSGIAAQATLTVCAVLSSQLMYFGLCHDVVRINYIQYLSIINTSGEKRKKNTIGISLLKTSAVVTAQLFMNPA